MKTLGLLSMLSVFSIFLYACGDDDGEDAGDAATVEDETENIGDTDQTDDVGGTEQTEEETDEEVEPLEAAVRQICSNCESVDYANCLLGLMHELGFDLCTTYDVECEQNSFYQCLNDVPVQDGVCYNEDGISSCGKNIQNSLLGTESSSCEDMCTKCNDCLTDYPQDEEVFYGFIYYTGFSVSECTNEDEEFVYEECITKCESDSSISDTLSQLTKPVSEFTCCEFEFLFTDW